MRRAVCIGVPLAVIGAYVRFDALVPWWLDRLVGIGILVLLGFAAVLLMRAPSNDGPPDVNV